MSTKLETIAQLAKRIAKPERQVRGWIDNALIRHNRLGGKIEIPVGAYEEMLAATEIQPTFAKKLPKQKPQSLPNPDQTTFLDPEVLDHLASEF
jgi:hypothetical protein